MKRFAHPARPQLTCVDHATAVLNGAGHVSNFMINLSGGARDLGARRGRGEARRRGSRGCGRQGRRSEGERCGSGAAEGSGGGVAGYRPGRQV
jgi:hypothetical protein